MSVWLVAGHSRQVWFAPIVSRVAVLMVGSSVGASGCGGMVSGAASDGNQRAASGGSTQDIRSQGGTVTAGAQTSRDATPPPPNQPGSIVVEPATVVYGENPNGAGTPAVASGDSDWLVAWPDAKVFLQPFDANLRALGTRQTIVSALASPWRVGLSRGADSYAFTIEAFQGGGVLGLADAAGMPLGSFQQIPDVGVESIGIDRYAANTGWVVAYAAEARQNGVGEKAVLASLLDAQGVLDGNPIELGATVGAVAVAAVQDRVVVVWTDKDYAWAAILSGVPLVVTATFPLVRYPFGEDHQITAATLRNEVVAAIIYDGFVHTVVIDPWKQAVQAGPTVVGTSERYDYSAGLAAVPERGFLGLCYPTGSDSKQSFALQMLGSDGSAWGTPVTIAQPACAAACSLAYHADRFAAVWWGACSNNHIGMATYKPSF
jgi:hypothetical protein